MLRAMDVEWLRGLLDRHAGLVRLVTLAPEADPGCVGIRMLVERGVVVALGHTACSYADAVDAAAAGATLTTHLFNGMAPLHHREPGPVGAALDPRVALRPTLIADLVHVHPAVVAAVFAATDPILVSDAVATDVVYFDSAVTEARGAAYLANGTLTGAVALLDDGVRNAVSVGVPFAAAHAAVSERPSAALGLTEPTGEIELDDALVVREVWRHGRSVYRRSP